MKEAIISTERINSYGSRVLTAGIDLTQYEKNPIVLYMHRRGRKEDMPIGIMTNLRVENGILYGTPKFDDDTEDERNISKKWDRGTLRMLSAGLDVLEWSEDPAMLVAGQTRPTVTKSKLIEVSVVDIGSNDDALQVGLDSLNALFADMTPAQKPLDLVKPAGGSGTATDVKLTWATATADQLADLRDNNREEYVRLYREHFGFAPEF